MVKTEISPGRVLLLSILTGLIAGGACILFYACTVISDQTRINHEQLLYLLPEAGLLIVFLYDGVFKDKDLSTGALFRRVQEGKPVSLWIAPMIFLSTCLAYLTGGSVGRAGSALQIGGGLATGVGRIGGGKSAEPVSPIGSWESTGPTSPIGSRESAGPTSPIGSRESAEPASPIGDRQSEDTLLVACGMSAAFTAILNTPLAGAVFGIEVLVLTRDSWRLLLPALISSYITWGISLALTSLTPITYTDFTVTAERFSKLSPADFGKLAVLALAATLVARMFCYGRRATAWTMIRFLKNPYLRVLAGTVLVIIITTLLGNMNCNGVGFSYVAEALGGNCTSFAFFWKLILTIITLGCGIRGGEIAPNIFIGATFGCAAAPLLGLDPCVGAAVCLVCVLSSVTNCSLAIFLYGCEAICLSPAAAAAFLLVSVIAHVLSGDIGLYREQPADQIKGKLNLHPFL